MMAGGYSREFYLQIGRCPDCGGSKDYPMLVSQTPRAICATEYHDKWYKLAFAANFGIWRFLCTYLTL